MTEPLERCDNCLKQFPESKMATHFGYCRRNIKKCAQCGEMYDINCQEEHEEEFHKKAVCQFCKKQFGVGEIQKHKNSCSQRTKYCEYCQLNVPLNEFPSHLKACESRTKACNKCKKPIAYKDQIVHLATCRGIVQQAKGYDQYLANQRSRDSREGLREQYSRPEYKVEQKKEPDYRRREIPTNNVGPSSSGIQRQKPTVPQVIQPPPRSQPTTVIPTHVGVNSKPSTYGNAYQGATYNPREGIPSNHIKQQPRDRDQYVIKNPTNVPSARNQIKTEVRPDIKRNEVNYNGGYQNNSIPSEIKREVPVTKPTVVHSSNVGYNYRNQPQREPYPPSRNYGQPQSQPQPKPTVMKKQEKKFDPNEYGGYSDDIPAAFRPELYKQSTSDPLEQDEQMQRALMESVQQNNKKSYQTSKNIPKELMNQDLMRASFCRDLDQEKQKAAYEQYQRNARKNVRR